jgi:hypothetical protein
MTDGEFNIVLLPHLPLLKMSTLSLFKSHEKKTATKSKSRERQATSDVYGLPEPSDFILL